MARLKKAAQRGRGSKGGNLPRPSDPQSPEPAQGYPTGNDTQDRLTQIHQVDSWRSYRNDTSNLQTATSFQISHPPYAPPFDNGQLQAQPLVSQAANAGAWTNQHLQAQEMSASPPLGQQGYPSISKAMNPVALSFRPSPSDEHSHFKPYEPLRVSNGTHERQVMQQATKALQSVSQVQLQTQAQRQPQVQPQDQAHRQAQGQNQGAGRYSLRQRSEPAVQPPPVTRRDRYPLRQRTDEQMSPYSTGAAHRIFSSAKTSGNTSPRYVPPPKKASPHPKWEVTGQVAPTPTKEYIRDADFDPAVRPVPQKLLVILDLNGTLLVRPSKYKPQKIIVRPGVPALLDYLFQNHVVMVYSSTRPQNCAAIIEKFFRPDQRTLLAAVWARDRLGLTQAQYDAKVQVYKKLEPIWQDRGIQSRAEPGRSWDHSNTVLVDDTQLKALAQPHNLLQIPEFLNNEPKDGIQAKLDWCRGEEAIVQSVQQKLEVLKWQVSVPRLIREWQTGKQQAPGVVDETIDQKALQDGADRVPSPSPTPSFGDWESSYEARQLQTPRDSPMSVTDEDLPQYKPVEVKSDDGVSSDDEGGATLDGLEDEINRNLSLNQITPDRRLNQTRQAAGAATGVGVAATSNVAPRVKPSELPAGPRERTDLARENQEDSRVFGKSSSASIVQTRQQTGNPSGTEGKETSEGHCVQSGESRATGKSKAEFIPRPKNDKDGVTNDAGNGDRGLDGEARRRERVVDEPMTPESLGA